MEIIYKIVDIYIVIVGSVIVIGNIVRLVLWIKCFKIENCSNHKCLFKEYCNKYHDTCDRETLERMLKSLDKD